MDQRSHWKVSGGGYGIHWPDIDEDLSRKAYCAKRLPLLNRLVCGDRRVAF